MIRELKKALAADPENIFLQGHVAALEIALKTTDYMNPDTSLETIREATALLHSGWTPGENVDDDATVEAGLEAMDALDGWLTKKGFLPAAWQR